MQILFLPRIWGNTNLNDQGNSEAVPALCQLQFYCVVGSIELTTPSSLCNADCKHSFLWMRNFCVQNGYVYFSNIVLIQILNLNDSACITGQYLN